MKNKKKTAKKLTTFNTVLDVRKKKIHIYHEINTFLTQYPILQILYFCETGIQAID